MSRVLIIEDDEWLAAQHARSLTREKYDVHVVANALDAVVAVDEFKPDALLMDVLLPGSTAFALLSELKSYSDTSEIPVVLCTNIAEDVTLENTKAYGVKRILDKATMHPSDVPAAIRSVL